MNVTRRHTIAGLLSMLASTAGVSATLADGRRQRRADTNQAVANDLQIVATGDVHGSQRAAGSQVVTLYDDAGNAIGVTAGNAVSNSGQIVSTGDVWLSQEAAGNQDVYVEASAREERFVDDGTCQPGAVWADPYDGTLFYCGVSGLWYGLPCRCGK